MPPPSTTTERPRKFSRKGEPLGLWVRGALLLIVTGLVTVFVLAIRLDPYHEDGSARRNETHRQLGLPPCTFLEATALPCPSCGMTTSFTLLMHGDVRHSLQANAVGTLLASFCLVVIPWALVSIVVRRAVFLASLEKAVICVIVVLLVLMLTRWAIVVGLIWLTGTAPGF